MRDRFPFRLVEIDPNELGRGNGVLIPNEDLREAIVAAHEFMQQNAAVNEIRIRHFNTVKIRELHDVGELSCVAGTAKELCPVAEDNAVMTLYRSFEDDGATKWRIDTTIDDGPILVSAPETPCSFVSELLSQTMHLS